MTSMRKFEPRAIELWRWKTITNANDFETFIEKESSAIEDGTGVILNSRIGR